MSLYRRDFRTALILLPSSHELDPEGHEKLRKKEYIIIIFIIVIIIITKSSNEPC